MLRRLFSLPAILSTIILSTYAGLEANAQNDHSLVHVKGYQAIIKTIPVLIETAGTIKSAQNAQISAKITGKIAEIPVILGSIVKKGDLLVSISANEISAQLKQSEAQLRQSKRELAREQDLFKKNATTSKKVQLTQDQYTIALAKHEEVKTMLEYTLIHAPFDGVITQKSAHVGDLATVGRPLLFIEDHHHLQVSTDIPESLLLDHFPGEKLKIHIPSAGIMVTGTIAEVAPAIDPASRTAELTIDLPTEKNLRIGQFARVMLPGSSKKSLFVPREAITRKGQLQRVFVINNNTAIMKLVRIGIELDGMVEIISGLTAGDIVTVSTNTPLHNGQSVKVEQ